MFVIKTKGKQAGHSGTHLLTSALKRLRQADLRKSFDTSYVYIVVSCHNQSGEKEDNIRKHLVLVTCFEERIK